MAALVEAIGRDAAWVEQRTPEGRQWLVIKTERRTSATASGSLPTPTANDVKMAGYQTKDGLVYATLPGSLGMARLPTPRSTDGDRGGRGDLIQAVRGNRNKHFTMPTPRPCAGLRSRGIDQAETQNALLPTVQKHDASPGYSHRYKRHGTKHGDANLNDTLAWLLPTPANQSQQDGARIEGGSAARKVWKQVLASPSARDWKSSAASPSTMAKNSRPLNEQLRNDVAPSRKVGTAELLAVSEWMMGYPAGWLGPPWPHMETRSCLKSRPSSAKRSSK